LATTNRGAQQRPLRTCRSIGRRDGRQRTDRCKLLVPERKCEKGIGTPHTTLSGSLRGQCSWVCCTLTARVRFVLLYSPCILMRQRTAFCKPLPYRVRLHASMYTRKLRCSMATMAMPANWSRLARRGSSRVSPGGVRTPDPVGVAARRSTDYAGPPDLIHLFICAQLR
jgi:hypothetical protein